MAKEVIMITPSLIKEIQEDRAWIDHNLEEGYAEACKLTPEEEAGAEEAAGLTSSEIEQTWKDFKLMKEFEEEGLL